MEVPPSGHATITGPFATVSCFPVGLTANGNGTGQIGPRRDKTKRSEMGWMDGRGLFNGGGSRCRLINSS